MKKAILTFGLFSLVVLTSFTTTETQTQSIIAETGDASKDTGGNTAGSSGSTIGGSNNRKLDFTVADKTAATNVREYNNSNQIFELRKKTDI